MPISGNEYEIRSNRGWFAIGMLNPKFMPNAGCLLRSAWNFGADYCFTIGNRYRRATSDTVHTAKHIPVHNYTDFYDFLNHRPNNAEIIGVELTSNAHPIKNMTYPPNGTIFVLGAEDNGIDEKYHKHFDAFVKLPGKISLNVAVAGSIVMCDYIQKRMPIESSS